MHTEKQAITYLSSIKHIIYALWNTYAYVYIYIYIYIYLYMYVCIYIYISRVYIYIYTYLLSLLIYSNIMYRYIVYVSVVVQDSVDSFRNSALMRACTCGSLEVVLVLLEAR